MLNLEDICKLIYIAIGIKICNQHMSDVFDGHIQGKYTIDIYHDRAPKADSAYHLVHLNIFGLITSVSYNGAKDTAFCTKNLLCCQ